MTDPLTYYLVGGFVPLGVLLGAALVRKPLSRAGVGLLEGLLLAPVCLGVCSVATLAAAAGVPALTWLRGRCNANALRGGWAATPLALVAGVSFVDYAYVRWMDFGSYRASIAEAQDRYPAIPRADLLPQPPPNPLDQTEPHPGGADWYENADAATKDAEDRLIDGRHLSKLSQVHRVHERWSQFFTRQRNFGQVRMGPLWRAMPDPPEERPVIPRLPQPTDLRSEGDGYLVDAAPPPAEAGAALAAWHAERGVDFVNAPGYGVLAGVNDDTLPEWGLLYTTPAWPLDQNAEDIPFLVGFRSHAMRSPPGEPLAPAWRLTRIDLIGLVTHNKPVAYASPDLPRMGDSSRAVVRPLTDFETEALPRLAAGEWVVAAANEYRLRAVGALPAAQACAVCHGVERGTLLGALSYDFARGTGNDR